MLKNKILFIISGSIAAYKSVYLISKLIQEGFEVKTVLSRNALNFIGAATLQGLTHNKVFIDNFNSESVMAHIELTKWADLTIVCPATANTINKIAHGIADSLITSLFLAHDWNKPYLIVPAMNSAMYNHPATKESITKLKQWGLQILPTDEGFLACKDYGAGKLLDPDEIFERIKISLQVDFRSQERLKLLITSGGTKESIDTVRYISNLSTGKTGAAIANYFNRRNNNVTVLLAEDAHQPSKGCNVKFFRSFDDLNNLLQNILYEQHFDAIIHLAAVADYSVVNFSAGSEIFDAPYNLKISSEFPEIQLKLKKNLKIVNKLKDYSQNKNIKIVAFKLTDGSISNDIQQEAVSILFNESKVDFVVANDLSDRKEGDIQNNFKVYSDKNSFLVCKDVNELSINLEKLLIEVI